jgi:hypothetical protein
LGTCANQIDWLERVDIVWKAKDESEMAVVGSMIVGGS